MQGSNNSLQMRLDAYIQQARANEQKLRQFQDMETKLLEAESFPQLCSVLVRDYRDAFGLDVVSLLLVDSGQQLANLLGNTNELEDEEASQMVSDNVHLVSDYYSLQELAKLPLKPELSAFIGERHERFFENDENLGSVAILPMHRHGLLLGYLCLGSHDAKRYGSDMATDFLERLAGMVSLSLQNALNIEYLRQLGLMDTLTSANNRRYFFQRMEEEINRAQRQAHCVGCLYMDLDFFKKINDHYGHAAGDMVLIHFSEIVRKLIRNSDVLARLGGEEFAVILPNISKTEMAEIAARIRLAVEETPCELTTDNNVEFTVSIGTSMFDLGHIVGEPIELGEMLVNQADEALLHAKQNNRNQVCTYEDIT